MTSIDSIDLETVTGGASASGTHFVGPCPGLKAMKLGDATKRDLAIANVQCGIALPSKKDLAAARHIFF